MRVKALKPLNYKGKTVEKGKVIELDDVVAKELIKKEAVVKVDEIIEQKIETNLNKGNEK